MEIIGLILLFLGSLFYIKKQKDKSTANRLAQERALRQKQQEDKYLNIDNYQWRK